MKREDKLKWLALGTAVAAIAAGGAFLAVKGRKNLKKLESKNQKEEIKNHIYFVGGGLASLAGAVYLIRDCGFDGEYIHIYEGKEVLGGSNDGAGDNESGFIIRGGRMLNEETYENFWDLMDSIPSLEIPDLSVKDEILNFDHSHPTYAKARLIDGDGNILDVSKMGFNNADRVAIVKLLNAKEEMLDDITIEEWFFDTPHFFETNFWYMWQTTFAFQKWSSAFEFRRYMNRMILEFSRIDTLEGVTRTPYNQYESVILPIKKYLDYHNVDMQTNTVVTDIDFDDDSLTVVSIDINDNGTKKTIYLNDGDKCIMTTGCMTDSSSLGSFNAAPPLLGENPASVELWKKVSAKKSGLGNPVPFFAHGDETNWESFTVTMNDDKLLKIIEKMTGNVPGSGALMTFKDSKWLISIVVAAQPHFTNQSENTTVFWGYGLYTDKEGDFVEKPMKYCTGGEILYELLGHMHLLDMWDEISETVIDVIPCYMPYIDAQFQPRKMSDRPKVIPNGSTNFAMIGQFVEIPEDMVFTEEYSVRSARMAVYGLMGIDKKICPVTQHKKNPMVIVKAMKKLYS